MIYKLRADRENYLNFYIDAYVIEKTIGDFFLLNQDHWVEFWKPLPILFQDDSDRRNIVVPPDITVWATENCLALNQKAYTALKNKLHTFGEFLPLQSEGTPYWLFHSTKKTDISHVDLSKSSRTIDEVDYIDVQTLAFKEETLDDLLVFQTEFNGYQNLYCTDNFRKLIESLRLNGLQFSEDLTCKSEP